ncbi:MULTISPECIES: DUF5107 domain-containing protein [unclassified Rathayibacter]|uniref:DUF5107 domain-containing protein n=1 Tax=unclassified Rathayibacter TaxID=2609250 RepID=UPI0006F20E9E|nr:MULTISPECIES: DUF5107 domain-containing protein [unclassified Rathayibacter]KQQ05564.1 hypothetical protein ASF42_03070 [Rathayibacter sp. Leaf294]KQS13427.1 hypothetical protein ASG06_03085 [Rathayibacter sp. Leaf185]
MLTAESTLILPPVPADQADAAVAVWTEPLLIDTYLPGEPDRYPAFLDSRVYQGSSGRVFPLPFHERIAAEKAPHSWDAVHLENRWLRLVVLPQLGGRLHIAYDKSADYDVFYRNNVIKPALVGLAGPWISGGIEFNWPQHHRPATFLPTDVSIEHEDDGSVTVWCSDHDPFARMKGMHGIRLRPDSSLIEARVRLFNRSEEVQTFLWWANVAAAVNDDYQSFFPTDVEYVADHAKRAVVSFPRVEGEYYGVDYPARVDAEHPDADRLDWYRNIPVPTSYMVTQTADAFFGGYDHGRRAGFVHWADRAISPGKKQWTWGDAPFGHAWDANLTDGDGPYVELMAGVYTDNQPDFSFLAPGETKTFSQYWYPITEIGPAQQATRDAALRLDLVDESVLRVGVAVTAVRSGLEIVVSPVAGSAVAGSALAPSLHDAAPGSPVVVDLALPPGVRLADLVVEVRHGGRLLVAVPGSAVERTEPRGEAPAPAVAPPRPAEVGTVEELFLIGQYLEQYRHATRSPEPYWEEALRRDPCDLRSNVALAARRHGAARYEEALALLRTALARQLAWAPNPADGEAHYRLGLTLRRLGRVTEAAEAFAKSAWNSAWVAPASLALARLVDPARAEELLRTVLRHDVENLQARDLLALSLRALGRAEEAERLLAETLAIDPLDQWARHLAGEPLTADAPTLLDVALEYASAGYAEEALEVLDLADGSVTALGQVNVAPLIAYHRAALLGRAVDVGHRDATHCLPSRLDDIAVLEEAVARDPRDGLAWSLLGSWYYDRGRGSDAIDAWRAALECDLDDSAAALVERNLGVAAYNVLHDPDLAARHYASARRRLPDDARLLFEADQLAERRGESAATRLATLEARPALVEERDDLSVVSARLLTAVGRHDEALRALASRRFQPWEGGEGQVLGAWDDASLAAARAAGDPETARSLVLAALTPPPTLGEARHTLATTAELHLALGDALAACGDTEGARAAWTESSRATGDFAGMAAQPFTERSAAAILALARLGDERAAAEVLDRFEAFVDELAVTPGEVDYFATSLPTMLLFHTDPQQLRDAEVARLRRVVAGLRESLPVRDLP